MLNNDDRNAIEGLFARLADVQRNSPPRDIGAERLIQEKVDQQPSAPYYMAQTILVQERALEEAERRIRELEAQERRGPWDKPQQGRQDDVRGGGGFLAGAAQTALGVTGGILVGNMIASMFGGGTAHASEAPVESAPIDDAGDADAGDAGFDGGFDDFDMGGGF